MSEEIIFPDFEYIVTDNHRIIMTLDEMFIPILNLQGIELYWPDEPKYEFGFTGFKPVENNPDLLRGGIYFHLREPKIIKIGKHE